jgi:replicative DNA helicase
MNRELRLQILRAVVSDRTFLKKAWRDVNPEHFQLREERLVAQTAVDFWEKYNDPIGPMLATEIADAVATAKINSAGQAKVKALIREVKDTDIEILSINALIDRVKQLHKTSFDETAMTELITAFEKGEFTASVLHGVIERAQKELHSNGMVSHSYFDGLAARMKRRAKWDASRIPKLLIEPLDERTPIINKGQFAIWLAPPSGGKGLALIHTSMNYAMQGFNVVHFTLEDNLTLVEDRMDAAITGIPIQRLKELPNRLRNRFEQMQKQIRGNLRVIDGTDETYTVSRIENEVEELAREGFVADVVVVDYDEEIKCERKITGEGFRRFEYEEIYTRMRRAARKLNVIFWSAAQTVRAAEGKRIITMKDTAESFAKMRRVFQAFTIGYDPENPHIKTIYVAKNRLGRGKFSVDIVSDYESALFYDREATAALQKQRRLEAKS